MDDKFADRMAELGDISSGMLTSRWEVVVGIANVASAHQKARLVLMACRDVLDRDADEWFWRPFRDQDDTFRVDDAVETHARLAEAVTGRLIGLGDDLTPMLVQLAVLAGHSPVHDELIAKSEAALEESSAEIPEFEPPKSYWSKANQDELRADGGVDQATLSTTVDRVATACQSAIAGLSKQVTALTEWATGAEQRFNDEQQMVQWLLGGVRADGKPWSGLSPATIAIDAARELSRYVLGAPQPRHEAILAQVLSVSGVADAAVDPQSDDRISQFEARTDAALAALTPITSALGAGTPTDKESTYQLARRVLWEVTTVSVWDAG